MTTTNSKFINAVFNIDIDTFKTLLETESFDLSMLQDIKYSERVICPIYWITQFWEIILEQPEKWNKGYKEKGLICKQKNLEIKKIFEEKFNVVFKPIDLYNTDFDISWHDKDDSFEEIFDNKNREELIANGHREMDIDLYIATVTFNFEEVERLLILGADPIHEFKEIEEDHCCIETIEFKSYYPELELNNIIFENEQIDPINSSDTYTIDLLAEYAANEKMLKLLYKYYSKKNG